MTYAEIFNLKTKIELKARRIARAVEAQDFGTAAALAEEMIESVNELRALTARWDEES